MPYRPAPAVALLCPLSAAARPFKSANALRRAMLSEGFACQGLWHGRRWCQRPTDWIAWDLVADAPLELGPLFDQNNGVSTPTPVRRHGPVPRVSRLRDALPVRRARVGREGNIKQRWDRKDPRTLVEGEPPVRGDGQSVPTRYDDDFFRRSERSWKRHRVHQWKPT